MQRGDMVRVASIDLGTVSSRLLLAEVKDGVIVDSCKRTVITDLGEGVDATGRFLDAAWHACSRHARPLLRTSRRLPRGRCAPRLQVRRETLERARPAGWA